MYCPNCGANNADGLNFCRSCGLNLEKIALSLLEQMPSAESAELLKKRQQLDRFGRAALWMLAIAGLTGFVSLLVTIFVRFILSGTNIAGGVMILSMLISVATMLFYLISRRILMGGSLRIREKRELPAYDTAKLLEERRFQPASVTADTEDLVYAETKTRKLE
ncbi:MAG: zinc ribbon domain-containing protein [Acidobacteria bacterium]|nr:zinc ribbon domain-containing protein [Acidobacteriota bacterium]